MIGKCFGLILVITVLQVRHISGLDAICERIDFNDVTQRKIRECTGSTKEIFRLKSYLGSGIFKPYRDNVFYYLSNDILGVSCCETEESFYMHEYTEIRLIYQLVFRTLSTLTLRILDMDQMENGQPVVAQRWSSQQQTSTWSLFVGRVEREIRRAKLQIEVNMSMGAEVAIEYVTVFNSLVQEQFCKELDEFYSSPAVPTSTTAATTPRPTTTTERPTTTTRQTTTTTRPTTTTTTTTTEMPTTTTTRPTTTTTRRTTTTTERPTTTTTTTTTERPTTTTTRPTTTTTRPTTTTTTEMPTTTTTRPTTTERPTTTSTRRTTSTTRPTTSTTLSTTTTLEPTTRSTVRPTRTRTTTPRSTTTISSTPEPSASTPKPSTTTAESKTLSTSSTTTLPSINDSSTAAPPTVSPVMQPRSDAIWMVLTGVFLTLFLLTVASGVYIYSNSRMISRTIAKEFGIDPSPKNTNHHANNHHPNPQDQTIHRKLQQQLKNRLRQQHSFEAEDTTSNNSSRRSMPRGFEQSKYPRGSNVNLNRSTMQDGFRDDDISELKFQNRLNKL